MMLALPEPRPRTVFYMALGAAMLALLLLVGCVSHTVDRSAPWGDPIPWEDAPLSVGRDAECRKAMAEYHREHPKCELCGTDKGVETHHIQPVSSRPDLAADKRNMISLCRSQHWEVGHAGRSWKYGAKGVREFVEANQ